MVAGIHVICQPTFAEKPNAKTRCNWDCLTQKTRLAEKRGFLQALTPRADSSLCPGHHLSKLLIIQKTNFLRHLGRKPLIKLAYAAGPPSSEPIWGLRLPLNDISTLFFCFMYIRAYRGRLRSRAILELCWTFSRIVTSWSYLRWCRWRVLCAGRSPIFNIWRCRAGSCCGERPALGF